MKRTTLTNANAIYCVFDGEKNTLPSQTVPDQALTPQELLRRFATGQPLNVQDNAVYDDDYGTDLPEFYKMDKLDRLHAMQENSFNVKELYSDFSDIKKKAEAKAKDAKRNEVKEPKIDASASVSEKNEENVKK